MGPMDAMGQAYSTTKAVLVLLLMSGRRSATSISPWLCFAAHVLDFFLILVLLVPVSVLMVVLLLCKEQRFSLLQYYCKD